MVGSFFAEPTCPIQAGATSTQSSTASDGFSVLHDVLAEGGDDCHQLLMLSCRHLVLVKGLREVANNNFEFGAGDPEPTVHRLRRTADHLAWASVTLHTRFLFFCLNISRVSVPIPTKNLPIFGSVNSRSAKSSTTAEMPL